MEQQEDPTTAGIPQPWDFNYTTREVHMSDAEKRELLGSHLVIETWVNGYVDPLGDGTEWIVDWLDYADYRTGERVGGYSPCDDEPGVELGNVYVVERRLVND